jgi:plastocyanin
VGRGISPRTRGTVAFGLAIVGAVALGATAWAGVPGSPVTITAQDTTFLNPTPAQSEGLVALFDNNDSRTHNVTAIEDGPDGKALFRTGNVSGPAINRPVNGTQFVAAGFYDFECTIHDEMQGTLQVVNDPGFDPVPRPEIEIKVKSKKLGKVVKSGKLKVKVEAGEPTDADGVSLSAKKGRKSIAKKASLNVNAGGSETAKLKLKKSALEKLADLDKAKVKVTAEVDFGSPAKASKKLK